MINASQSVSQSVYMLSKQPLSQRIPQSISQLNINTRQMIHIHKQQHFYSKSVMTTHSVMPSDQNQYPGTRFNIRYPGTR